LGTENQGGTITIVKFVERGGGGREKQNPKTAQQHAREMNEKGKEGEMRAKKEGR